jgi:hypothetical protein
MSANTIRGRKRNHGGPILPAPHLRDRALIDWYGALAHALARQGMHVVLFTNGSPEDRECLVSHAADWTQERAAADWIGGAPCLSRGRISLAAPLPRLPIWPGSSRAAIW